MLNENIIYLPSHSLKESASLLSLPHLLKQRTLSLNVLSLIQTHPIPPSYQSTLHLTNRRTVHMWNGYHALLALFGYSVCREIKRREHPETLSHIFEAICIRNVLDYPTWYTERELEKITAGHRSALVQLDPIYYTAFSGENHHPLYWPESSVPVNPFRRFMEVSF